MLIFTDMLNVIRVLKEKKENYFHGTQHSCKKNHSELQSRIHLILSRHLIIGLQNQL